MQNARTQKADAISNDFRNWKEKFVEANRDLENKMKMYAEVERNFPNQNDIEAPPGARLNQ